jgi:conjugative relaxase-like TrwC/TraI family protein
VISIARLAANADTTIYYLEAIANDRDDYYVASGEVPGRWLGWGSALLGLNGEVSPEDLRAILLDGLDPRTGEALVGYRKNSGFDLTLSAPKSVSLLWGLGDRATAEQVVAAHDQAVLTALAYLEDAACTVRRGKGGSVHHRAGGLVVATFRHRTSREADPQLHTHLVTANMALGPDRRWTALHSADIWHHARPTTRRSAVTSRGGTQPSTGSGSSRRWPRPRRKDSRSSRSSRGPTPSSPDLRPWR